MEGGGEEFVARRPAGVETLRLDPRVAGAFAFRSRAADEELDRFELHARPLAPGGAVDLLAFPDVRRLVAEGVATEVEPSKLNAMKAILAAGRPWLAKFSLAADPDREWVAKAALPGADWAELRRRDLKLGTRYRAALAKQGVGYPSRANRPATRPAK